MGGEGARRQHPVRRISNDPRHVYVCPCPPGSVFFRLAWRLGTQGLTGERVAGIVFVVLTFSSGIRTIICFVYYGCDCLYFKSKHNMRNSCKDDEGIFFSIFKIL